ncbi:MAG: DNA polymerase III subunit delta [Bdellovibrionota bacterium]
MAVYEANVFYERVQSRESSFIFLYGDESYLLKQAYKFCVDSYQVNTEDIFNYEVFDLSETTWEKVSESISQLPMMADQRTIIVKNAEEIDDDDLPQIEKDLTAIAQPPLVILMSEGFDKKRRAFKLLTTKCLSCEFKPPYENQIPQWIHYMAEQKGLKITAEAVHSLLHLTGTNLGELDAEMEKIVQFISPSKVIEEDKVREVLGRTRHDSVFSFIEELYSRNHVNALVMMADLLGQGQNEIGLMSLLARHLRILLQIQQGSKEGLRGAQLAQKAGVSPYFLNKYLQQSHFWPTADLHTLLARLAETETELKSSSVPNHFLLENLVLNFYRVSEQNKTASK